MIRKALGKLLDYDDTAHEAGFVVSTEGADRDQDVVFQRSINWKEFDLNPTMTVAHETGTIPVGKWLPETRQIVSIVDPKSGQKVLATVMRGRFNTNTTQGRETAGSVKGGFLNGASVSFLPDENGTEKNDQGGSNYASPTVTEIAVCSVPANQGATRLVEMVLKALKDKPMKIKFWRHKTDKGRVRVLRKDLAALTKAFERVAKSWDVETRADGYYVVSSSGAEEGPFKDKVRAVNLARQCESDDRMSGADKSTEGVPQATQLEPLDKEPEGGMDDFDLEEIEPGPSPEEQTPVGAMLKEIMDTIKGMSPDELKTVAASLKAKAEESGKSEDMANTVADRTEQMDLGDDDAGIDAAMEEGAVPEAMKRAVKALAKKRLKAKREERSKSSGPYKLISSKGTQTVNGSEQDAIRAAKEMERRLQPAYGVTVEDSSGNTVAEVNDGKVERSFKAAKSKALEGAAAPHGLMTLRKWAKAISDDMGSLHEAEHKGVMACGRKAMDGYCKEAQKSYGCDIAKELGVTPGTEQTMDDDETDDDDPKAKEMKPVQTEGGVWTIYDPTTDEYVGEFDSEEAAKRGIHEGARAEVPTAGGKSKGVDMGNGIVIEYDDGTDTYYIEKNGVVVKERIKDIDTARRIAQGLGGKSFSRRPANLKRKSMNKATKTAIGDAVEFMEGCAESKDMPKFMKSGHKHHAMTLKELIKEAEPVMPEDTDMGAVEQMAKKLDAKMDDFDMVMKRRYGQQYSRD